MSRQSDKAYHRFTGILTLRTPKQTIGLDWIAAWDNNTTYSATALKVPLLD